MLLFLPSIVSKAQLPGPQEWHQISAEGRGSLPRKLFGSWGQKQDFAINLHQHASPGSLCLSFVRFLGVELENRRQRLLRHVQREGGLPAR